MVPPPAKRRYRTPPLLRLPLVAACSLLVGAALLYPTLELNVGLWVFLGGVAGTAAYLSRKRVSLEILGSGLVVLAVALAFTPALAYLDVVYLGGNARSVAGTAILSGAHWLLSWGVAFGTLALCSATVGQYVRTIADRRRRRRERRRAKRSS